MVITTYPDIHCLHKEDGDEHIHEYNCHDDMIRSIYDPGEGSGEAMVVGWITRLHVIGRTCVGQNRLRFRTTANTKPSKQQILKGVAKPEIR